MSSPSVEILKSVSGVGPSTVTAIRDAGYQTLDDLEGVSLNELKAISHVGETTAKAILVFLSNPEAHEPVQAYRYSEMRTNNPPAGLAAHGHIREIAPESYSYDPHLPPTLRFDESGREDETPELLGEAKQRALTREEIKLLENALRNHQPWLEWAGKREHRWFGVDPVALHIHERLSAEAIIKLAQRKPLQRSLWADPELEFREAVQFYQHDIDWANRLILGDSLVVLHSLAERENLAGKVQMIYVDPPYGIKFSSNFQPLVGRREVKDSESDLTREPEQVKAYRDTWVLGVHSYLAYMRDRLIVAKELLRDSGSIFVQISEDNVHRVRALMDEVFGSRNFVAEIIFTKTTGLGQELLDTVNDFILWYCRDNDKIKYRQLFTEKVPGEPGATRYTKEDSETGDLYTDTDLRSQSGGETIAFTYEFQGRAFSPHPLFWKTTENGFRRLAAANRLLVQGNTLRYKRYLTDFRMNPLTNLWNDVGGIQSRTDPKIYVTQTTNKVIERCMLMTTDPGDLVLDPTCGSGTTAYEAEKWGRRWITIDTSRVAIALARQRLVAAKFDYYDLMDPNKGPAGGFRYESFPHITLKSIARNDAVDLIIKKHEEDLAKKLETLNDELTGVPAETRNALKAKLLKKENAKGKRAITEANRRRWLLPQDGWKDWEVPFDTDPDWPENLRKALTDYRNAWRERTEEISATISASARQEEQVDQPEVLPSVLRVSGPFTVEGVQPVEETLEVESPIGGALAELETFEGRALAEPVNAEAYIDKMIDLLRKDGVRFPDNKVQVFMRLEPLPESILHAEGEWGNGESDMRKVAVSIGPQYGPVTAKQVEECLREAYRRGYDDLVFAGFTFDGAAQAAIQEDPNPKVRCHLAHIRPDVNMGDLLKDTPGSQLFTVFGLPRARIEKTDDGEFVIEMEGVDIYDPITNTLQTTGADKVAAWFIDCDYNGRTFCVSQAFFPDSRAWDNLAKALKSVVDPVRFSAFSSTRSLAFPAGDQNRVAVKVIDPRGNEVMRVLRLDQRARDG